MTIKNPSHVAELIASSVSAGVSMFTETNVKYKQVLTAAQSYFDVTGLSLLADGAYEFDLMMVNPSVTTNVCLFVNGDVTLSNYYAEGIIAYGSTTTCSGTTNQPTIGAGDASTTVYMTGSIFIGGGMVRVVSQCFRDYSSAHISAFGFKKTASVTDVTTLRFGFDRACTFGIGSSLVLRKRDLVGMTGWMGSGGLLDWSAPIAVSSSTTLTLNKTHNVTGASNYSITMPSGTLGAQVGVRIDPSATGFFTVGTQVMWAGELVEWVYTASGWTIQKKMLRPMTATAYKSFSSTLTMTQGSPTKVPLDTFSSGSCTAMFSVANTRFEIKRTNYYNIFLRLSVMSGSGNYFQVRVHKNGSFLANMSTGAVNPVGDAVFNQDFQLAVDDYIELYYYSSISGAQLYGPQTDLHFGRLTELNP